MKKRKKNNGGKIIILIIIILIVAGIIFFHTRPKLVVVSVVNEIAGYNYKLESNATRLYKKYFNELDTELKDNEIDEENYAKLVSKLFIIDFYTLNNKVTNKDIGGIDYIHSMKKNEFISNASSTIYKYVKNNLYGTRKQKLPEVNNVEIISVENIVYKKDLLKDDKGYKVKAKIGYVKNLDYPKETELVLIHEDNKLAIVEIK